MSDEPTQGEILRRLEALTQQVQHLVATLEERYVSRIEFDLRVGELEKDAKEASAFKRQVLAGVMVSIIVMVITAAAILTRGQA